MKVLVAIANHGLGNREYLDRLLAEYAGMSFEVSIIVLSNIPKDLGPDIDVRVGVPTRNPWSLPFGHRDIFAAEIDAYDLFIYSEDDTLITERNISAFLRATDVLPEDEIAGFLRIETDGEGSVYISSAHSHFHWDPSSPVTRGGMVFASFTNHHGAAYILTRAQLAQAIASGGFLVPPHEGRYDMLVSAATDPYTQCGMEKLICLSELDDFLLPHLSARYVGRMGVARPEFDVMVRMLMATADRAESAPELLGPETKLPEARFSKVYFEPRPEDVVDEIPSEAKTVLSIGCGSGLTEAELIRRGKDVTAVPLDNVIGSLAESRGVSVLDSDLAKAVAKLADRRFDCILALGVVHLLEKPERLFDFGRYLSDDGVLLVTAPNFHRLSWWVRRILGLSGMGDVGDFEAAGVQATSSGLVSQWATRSGLEVERILYDGPQGIGGVFRGRQLTLIAKRGVRP